MFFYLKLLVFLIILTLVKGHFRLIILAALGLIGLYLAHILALDYQNITKPTQVIRHLLGKRSIDYQKNSREINFDLILENDPIDCFKSFLCQISTNMNNSNRIEGDILNIARTSQQFQKYLIHQSKNLSTWKDCVLFYKTCPFKKKTMLDIIGYVEEKGRRVG